MILLEFGEKKELLVILQKFGGKKKNFGEKKTFYPFLASIHEHNTMGLQESPAVMLIMQKYVRSQE